MDKGMAGVLVKAQSNGQSASNAYAAICPVIAAFKGMPRAKFDRLWAETAAARPTGNLSPYARWRQWVGNLTGVAYPGLGPVGAVFSLVTTLLRSIQRVRTRQWGC